SSDVCSSDLAQRAALDHLEHGRHLAAAHTRLRVLARVGDGRGKALDQLAGDADDDLAWDRARHVLGRLERAVARLDYRLEVRDRAAGHRRRPLRFAADPEHFAVGAVAAHDQDLDEVCADVQHGEVPVVVAALPKELELGHFRASARRWNASSAGTVSVPVTRWAGPPPLPKNSFSRLASYRLVRSLDTLMTNLSPAIRVTTPDLIFSRYRSA